MTRGHPERNGYWFWGLLALFIGVPEVLAALSSSLGADIPWPTISNLVGRHLERRHHWVALLVVGVIVLVAYHAVTYPDAKKRGGHAVREPENVTVWTWGGWYVACVAIAGSAAGLVASLLDAGKVALGFAIYGTLALGAVAPGALAYVGAKVLDVPTLFATIADLQKRAHWAAATIVALLVVLIFHLALYPWPNFAFGGP